MNQQARVIMPVLRQRLITLCNAFFDARSNQTNLRKFYLSTDRVILGIDPGTSIMGFGVIHISGNKMHLLELGVLRLEKLEGHPLKLKEIFESSIRMIDRKSTRLNSSHIPLSRMPSSA